MTRHLGYFIQNTIRPLVEDLNKALKGCKAINVKKQDLQYFVDKLVELEMRKLKIRSVVHIILGILFCLAIYLILV